jgi:hypothetical protein
MGINESTGTFNRFAGTAKRVCGSPNRSTGVESVESIERRRAWGRQQLDDKFDGLTV